MVEANELQAQARRIAQDLTVGQWLVLLGPRNFGRRGGQEAHDLFGMDLLRRREGVWPLTELGEAVIAERPCLRRSALGERAKRVFERECARRETASLADLKKMLDPWDAVVSEIYTEIDEVARAQQRRGADTDNGGSANE